MESCPVKSRWRSIRIHTVTHCIDFIRVQTLVGKGIGMDMDASCNYGMVISRMTQYHSPMSRHNCPIIRYVFFFVGSVLGISKLDHLPDFVVWHRALETV